MWFVNQTVLQYLPACHISLLCTYHKLLVLISRFTKLTCYRRLMEIVFYGQFNHHYVAERKA